MSSQLIPYKRHVSVSMCEKLILHTIGYLYYVCCWSDVCVHVCANRTYIKQALTCIVQDKLRSKDLRAVIGSCNMNTSLRGPNHIDDQSLNGLITCTTMLCPLLPSFHWEKTDETVIVVCLSEPSAVVRPKRGQKTENIHKGTWSKGAREPEPDQYRIFLDQYQYVSD